ncbi:hypothetical protein [Paraburkholderia fungorum]|uniref:hypothetical protein n=1 Tax=Paraburkholderia fungorum TaxID=134537 RepID=UPI00241D931E|nr:hypothetical protein [Paraburkholderia fungorum]
MLFRVLKDRQGTRESTEVTTHAHRVRDLRDRRLGDVAPLGLDGVERRAPQPGRQALQETGGTGMDVTLAGVRPETDALSGRLARALLRQLNGVVEPGADGLTIRISTANKG